MEYLRFENCEVVQDQCAAHHLDLIDIVILLLATVLLLVIIQQLTWHETTLPQPQNVNTWRALCQ